MFRVSGHDLYLDLPLAPWEAVLGTSIEVPTPAGHVRLKVPAGTRAGQQLRLPKRGLPKPHRGAGDLYAMVQIVVPSEPTAKERSLFEQLADGSRFNPRGHFDQEAEMKAVLTEMLWMDEHTTITLSELAELSGLSPDDITS